MVRIVARGAAPSKATAAACCLSAHRFSRNRREPTRHVLDAVDERGKQPLRLARDLEIGQLAKDLSKHDRDLSAGEIRPEAEVRTTAEADVLVRIATNVEAIGIGEDGFVTVPGIVEEQQLVALAEAMPGGRSLRPRSEQRPRSRSPRCGADRENR